MPKIPLLDNDLLGTFCEILTFQTNGFVVDDEIYVPAVTPVPVIYCPIAITPVIDDVIVSIVPAPPLPLLMLPVKVLACVPFVIAIGLPTDPTD